jgi:LysR family transcriptional regulator, regulator for bpeEF and oprC
MSNSRNVTDSLAAISIFVTVGGSVSFTSAAQKLQMSVSGVSKAVTRLEERLGARLLNRTSRRIALTDEGAAYFARCQQILHDLEEAEAIVAQARSRPRGRMRVQLPRGLGKKVVMPAIAGFLDRYPEVSIDILLDAPSLNLEEEGIDVSVRYGAPTDSLLVAKKLSAVKYLVCAAPSYLKQRGEPRTVNDLRNHRLINYIVPGTGRYRRWNFNVDGKTVTLDVTGALNVIDMGALAEAAVSGAGIAYLPHFMATDHIVDGDLKVLLPETIYEGQAIYMVYLRRRHASPRLQVFLDFLREVLSGSSAALQSLDAKQEKEKVV